jgi:Xaa-Pro aminopeptidase
MNIPNRIQNIQAAIKDRDLAGLVVSRYPCIGYLTGVFQRWGCIMLIGTEAKPVLCSGEIKRVEDEAWDPEVLDLAGPPRSTSVVYYSRIQAAAEQIKGLGLAGERIGIEKAYMSAVEYEALIQSLPRAQLVDASDLIPRLMLIKDRDELKVLRKLASIADAGLYEALKCVKVGMTELEVAGLMDLAMHRLGAEKLWFPTHVASGYRSNFNMAYPTDKIIQFGDKVSLDVGPMLQLYCGQLNVHVVVGKSLSAYKKLFTKSARLLKSIFKSIKPGRKASEVFSMAQEKGRQIGFKEVTPHFGRGLGTIDNEELLTLSPSCHTELAPGMVLAIITYVRDGEYLISNEKMIEVTEKKGARWLSTFPLELVEI